MRPWMAVLLMAVPCLGLAAPPWATDNTQKRTGSILEIVCQGVGPSISLAREEALRECRLNAASQAQATVKVSQVSIETERSQAFHGEVSQEEKFKGLECIPLNETVEEKPGQFTLWLKCRFDLSKAEPLREGEESKEESLPQQKRLYIGSIPSCDTILIRGKRPRIIQCSNPTSFLIEEGDEKIVVRSAGYIPKNIKVRDIKEPSFDVILKRSQR